MKLPFTNPIHTSKIYLPYKSKNRYDYTNASPFRYCRWPSGSCKIGVKIISNNSRFYLMSSSLFSACLRSSSLLRLFLVFCDISNLRSSSFRFFSSFASSSRLRFSSNASSPPFTGANKLTAIFFHKVYG